jgi:hypothetical protein
MNIASDLLIIIQVGSYKNNNHNTKAPLILVYAKDGNTRPDSAL